MAASIFKAAWWPIHVAVAWVLTRNRALVERSNRAGRSLRSIAVAIAMDKVRGKPTGRYFKRATKAWSALREEIAAGNVRASGTPFRRVADLEGDAVGTSEMAREIPAVEIASLRLQDDGDDKDCLVPEDWRVAHGSNWNNLRGYRNVRFSGTTCFAYSMPRVRRQRARLGTAARGGEARRGQRRNRRSGQAGTS